MKALLGTMIMLSAVSAKADTTVTNQMLAGLYGTNCANNLVTVLKKVTTPDWSDTIATGGYADAKARFLKYRINENMQVYRDILPTIEGNLAEGKSNAAIYAQIEANIKRHENDGITDEDKALSKAASACVRRYIKLKGTTVEQQQSIENAKKFFTKIEGAVK